MKHVFISYAREDRDFIQELHDALVDKKLSINIDWGLDPGAPEWWDEIKSFIEESNNLVFVISPNSIRSIFCNLEIAHARKLGKRIITVVRHEVEFPQENRSIVADVEEQFEDEPEDGKAKHAANEYDQGGNIAPIIYSNISEVRRHGWIFARPADNFDKAIEDLVTAVTTNYDYLQERTQLLVRAITWQDYNKPRNDVNEDEQKRFIQLAKDSLLRGEQLNSAQKLLDSLGKERPNDGRAVIVEFIRQSEQAAAKLQRTIRTIAIAAAALFFVLAVALLLSLQQVQQNLDLANTRGTQVAAERDRADQNAATATVAQGNAEVSAAEAQSRAAAASAELLQNANPDLALALALEANKITNPSPSVQNLLASIAYNSRVRNHLFEQSPITALSINPDQSLVAAGSTDGKVLIWNIQSGQSIGEFSIESNDDLISLVFMPDGERLIVGSTSGLLGIWNIQTGQEEKRFDTSDLVTSLALSPDGRFILSGSGNGVITLWDVETQTIKDTFEGHIDWISSLAFSPDGTTALSGSYDTTAILWNIETAEILHQFEGHEDWVTSAAFSPDGETIVTGSSDSTLILWDSKGDGIGERVQTFTGHEAGVRSTAFGPSGKTIISGSVDNSLILWDVGSGQPIHHFVGHVDAVNAAAYLSDSQLISASEDASLIVWDIEMGALERRYQHNQGEITALAQYENIAVSASFDPINEERQIIFWNIETGEAIQTYTEKGLFILSLVFSPDGKYLLAGSRNLETGRGEILLWDAESRQITKTFGEEISGFVSGLAFLPDGKQAVSVSDDGNLFIWDVFRGKPNGEPLRRREHYPTRAAIMPNGDQILGAYEDGKLVLWDIESGNMVGAPFGASADTIVTLAVSSDGQFAASGSVDRTITLWDLQQQKAVAVLEGHIGAVNTVAFSPPTANDPQGGRYLVSGGDDNQIILWDIQAAQPFRNFQAHTRSIAGVYFTPDGRNALSASLDGTLILWRFDSQAELYDWISANRHYIPVLNCEDKTRYQGLQACATPSG